MKYEIEKGIPVTKSRAQQHGVYQTMLMLEVGDSFHVPNTGSFYTRARKIKLMHPERVYVMHRENGGNRIWRTA